MVDISTVMELKKSVKKLGQEKDRAEGRVEQLLKTLKEKFGCTSLKKAQELLKKEKKSLMQLEKEFETKENAFMKKWGAKLSPEDEDE